MPETLLPPARMTLLALVLGAAAVTDLRRGVIPNALTASGALLALALGLAGAPTETLTRHVVAAVATGGGLLGLHVGGVWLTGRPGLGMGDVKLGAVLGLLLGWQALWVLYLAALFGGGVGLTGLLLRRWDRTHRLPFAPFVAVGAALGLTCFTPSEALALAGLPVAP